MIAFAFVAAIVGFPVACGVVAGWMRCGQAPWTRHFWTS